MSWDILMSIAIFIIACQIQEPPARIEEWRTCFCSKYLSDNGTGKCFCTTM